MDAAPGVGAMGHDRQKDRFTPTWYHKFSIGSHRSAKDTVRKDNNINYCYNFNFPEYPCDNPPLRPQRREAEHPAYANSNRLPSQYRNEFHSATLVIDCCGPILGHVGGERLFTRFDEPTQSGMPRQGADRSVGGLPACSVAPVAEAHRT